MRVSSNGNNQNLGLIGPCWVSQFFVCNSSSPPTESTSRPRPRSVQRMWDNHLKTFFPCHHNLPITLFPTSYCTNLICEHRLSWAALRLPAHQTNPMHRLKRTWKSKTFSIKSSETLETFPKVGPIDPATSSLWVYFILNVCLLFWKTFTVAWFRSGGSL